MRAADETLTPPQARVRSIARGAMALSVALLVFAPAAGATTVLRQSWGSLTGAAAIVVRGHVVAVEGHAPTEGHPFRIARVSVAECVAGECPATVAVRVPGGADVQGRTWFVPGAPDPAVGDEVFLFLERVAAAVVRRPSVPAGGPSASVRRPAAIAAAAAGPAPDVQFAPVSLAVGAYLVVRDAGAEPVLVQDSAARGARQVGRVTEDEAAPARVPLAVALAAVRSAAARTP